MKKLLSILLFPLALISQTYPIVEEFNAGTTWTYTNGAGQQNYGGAENYATFNIGSTPYPNNANITITSPTYDFTNSCNSNLTISFPIVGAIENNDDIMSFQYYSGGAWVTQSTFTGNQNTTTSYSISNSATQFRFLLVTNCSVNGFKGGSSSCNLTTSTCTPAIGNCSGLTSVYYYDIARFTISCTLPLPVTILKFDVSCLDHRGIIEWTTISEYNNDYFTIERSIDGLEWKTITNIKGDDGYIYRKYKFVDSSLGDEYTYYRLSQTDFNGEITYIGIRATMCDGESSAIYYNLQGIVVDIDNVPSGIYIKRQGNSAIKIIK